MKVHHPTNSDSLDFQNSVLDERTSLIHPCDSKGSEIDLCLAVGRSYSFLNVVSPWRSSKGAGLGLYRDRRGDYSDQRLFQRTYGM